MSTSSATPGALDIMEKEKKSKELSNEEFEKIRRYM
jgi:hypothetical protein